MATEFSYSTSRWPPQCKPSLTHLHLSHAPFREHLALSQPPRDDGPNLNGAGIHFVASAFPPMSLLRSTLISSSPCLVSNGRRATQSKAWILAGGMQPWLAGPFLKGVLFLDGTNYTTFLGKLAEWTVSYHGRKRFPSSPSRVPQQRSLVPCRNYAGSPARSGSPSARDLCLTVCLRERKKEALTTRHHHHPRRGTCKGSPP